MTKKKKYYAVAVGKKPGIYTEWFGSRGAETQIRGFQGAKYKGFPAREEAEAFIKGISGKKPVERSSAKFADANTRARAERPDIDSSRKGGVVIYTDGGCLNNPGPGGYGVVIYSGKTAKEFSGGFQLTTNNRMELMACIVGLSRLTKPSDVTLYSDSRYVVNGITKGWAAKWKRNGWIKSDKKPAINPDLWEQLLALCEKHDVAFVWVKGHAGNAGNERCDQLATEAIAKTDLPSDKEYLKSHSGHAFASKRF